MAPSEKKRELTDKDRRALVVGMDLGILAMIVLVLVVGGGVPGIIPLVVVGGISTWLILGRVGDSQPGGASK